MKMNKMCEREYIILILRIYRNKINKIIELTRNCVLNANKVCIYTHGTHLPFMYRQKMRNSIDRPQYEPGWYIIIIQCMYAIYQFTWPSNVNIYFSQSDRAKRVVHIISMTECIRWMDSLIHCVVYVPIQDNVFFFLLLFHFELMFGESNWTSIAH